MILKLTHIQGFWPQNHKCNLLKLGENSLDEINKIKDKTKTILLLDSLDEDPQCKDGKTIERLTKILDASTNFKRVIITCRTQFFPEDNNDESVFKTQGKISFAGYNCPLNYLSLFSDEQVEEYLQKRYEKNWWQKIAHLITKQPNPKVEQANKALKTTDSLQFRPFLLSHIEDVIEAVEQGANEYQVYHALIDKWLDREVKKLRQKGQKANKQDLLLVSIWIAETMARNNSHVVTLKEIERFCQKESRIQLLSDNPEKVVKSVNELDISANALLNRNSEGDFRFSHLSIREFLIVYGVEKEHLSGLESPYISTDKMANFLRHADLSHPFQFKHKDGNYVLYGSKLESKNQLKEYELINAKVHWPEFLSAKSRTIDIIQKCEIELEIILLELLYDQEYRHKLSKQKEQKEFALPFLVKMEKTESDIQQIALLELQKLLGLNKIELSVNNRTKIETKCIALAKELTIVISVSDLIKGRARTEFDALIKQLNNYLSESKHFIETIAEKLVKRLNQSYQLQKIDLSQTQLNNVDLMFCNLTQMKLTDASLVNLDCRSSFIDKANLRNANLNRSNFEYSSLSMTDLTIAQLEKANLAEVNLTEANLTGANLTEANLTKANLAGANLTGANLTGANLTGANLTGANLTRANLTYIELTGAILTNTIGLPEHLKNKTKQ